MDCGTCLVYFPDIVSGRVFVFVVLLMLFYRLGLHFGGIGPHLRYMFSSFFWGSGSAIG